jgi:DNA-directed RNA polymerase specialized sigma subunit
MKIESRYQSVYDLWRKNPSPRTNTLMLQALAPIINTAVKTYGGADASPVLRSRARQLVLSSLPRYDPERAKLSTFLMQQLQNLQRFRFAEQDAIDIPEQVRLDQSHLSQKENELSDHLGRTPSLSELADATGLSIGRINHIRSAKSGLSESAIRGPAPDDGVDGGVGSPAVTNPAWDDTKAWTEFVYYDSDPTDQVILENSFGLFDQPKLTNQEIAQKLRISPPAVSQRRTKIQAKLDQRSDFEVF